MKKYLTYLNDKPDKFWQIQVTGSSLAIAHGTIGTIGKVSVQHFADKKKCLQQAEKRLHGKLKSGYLESREGFVAKEGELPPELKEVLKRKRKVGASQGVFTIWPMNAVKLITVLVDHRREDDTARRIANNPHQQTDGLFCCRAYVLLSYAHDHSDQEKILVWLPGLSLYGAWDPGFHQLHVFPGASWHDIEKNLSAHLLEPGRHSFPNVLDHIRIWKHFDFIPKNLSFVAGNILALPKDERQKEVTKFLNEYEYKLQRLPFCSDLEDAFRALVSIYYAIGQWLQGEFNHAKAVEWFELSVPIINQSSFFRAKFFRDIFLQLSFCYLQLSKFDHAVRYINIYQRYDASAAEACEQIKASILKTQQLYKESMHSYLKSLEQGSDNGQEEAANEIQRAIKKAPNDPILHFNLACFYSVSHRIKEALYHLEEAFKKGYYNYEKVLKDRDLANIRHTREFENIRLKYLLVYW
jgi:predicted DNA-binding WGR domain protein/tetratricopeptide (TPR) repeat protein